MLTLGGTEAPVALLVAAHLVHRLDITLDIGTLAHAGHQLGDRHRLGFHVGVETEFVAAALIHIAIQLFQPLEDIVALPCPCRLVGEGVALDHQQRLVIEHGNLHRLDGELVMVDVAAPLRHYRRLVELVADAPHGNHRVVATV